MITRSTYDKSHARRVTQTYAWEMRRFQSAILAWKLQIDNLTVSKAITDPTDDKRKLQTRYRKTAAKLRQNLIKEKIIQI